MTDSSSRTPVLPVGPTVERPPQDSTTPVAPHTRDINSSPPRLIRVSGINLERAARFTDTIEQDIIPHLEQLLVHLMKEEKEVEQILKTKTLTENEEKIQQKALYAIGDKIYKATELLETLENH